MTPVGRRLISGAGVAVLLIGACGAGRPSSPAAGSAATASEAPLQSTIPSAPFVASATTLRTIGSQLGAEPILIVGKPLPAHAGYASHAASYTSAGLTISAVLHEPTTGGAHPGVVVVHGLVDPATYVTMGELRREQDALASAGYVVLDTDLRGLAGSDPSPPGPPDLDIGSTIDVINAVRALASSGLKSVDGSRIGLLGHSLGGLLVLRLLVATPGLSKAAVAFAPSNPDTFVNVQQYLTPGEPGYGAVSAAYGSPRSNPAFWADMSVLTFLDRVTEPLLIVHGDHDRDSPYPWSVATEAAWRAAGKDVRLVTLPGEDHVFDAAWPTAMAAVLAFFEARLAR